MMRAKVESTVRKIHADWRKMAIQAGSFPVNTDLNKSNSGQNYDAVLIPKSIAMPELLALYLGYVWGGEMVGVSPIPSPWGLEDNHYPYWSQALATYRDPLTHRISHQELWFILDPAAVPEVFDIPSTVWRYLMPKTLPAYAIAPVLDHGYPVKLVMVFHKQKTVIKGPLGLLLGMCAPSTFWDRRPQKADSEHLTDALEELWHSATVASGIWTRTKGDDRHYLRADISLYALKDDAFAVLEGLQAAAAGDDPKVGHLQYYDAVEEAFTLSAFPVESSETLSGADFWAWIPILLSSAEKAEIYCGHPGIPHHPADPFLSDSYYFLHQGREQSRITLQDFCQAFALQPPRNIVKVREAPDLRSFDLPRLLEVSKPKFITDALALLTETLHYRADLLFYLHSAAIFRVMPGDGDAKPEFWVALDGAPNGNPLAPAIWPVFLLHPQFLRRILYVYPAENAIQEDLYDKIGAEVSSVLGSSADPLKEIAWVNWAGHVEAGLQSTVVVEALYNHASIMGGYRRDPAFYTQLYRLYTRQGGSEPFLEAKPFEKDAFIVTKIAELESTDPEGTPLPDQHEPGTPIAPRKYWKYFAGRV